MVGRSRLRSLDRKLLRELWALRMQMLSITAVVATGIMTVLTMRGTYESLVVAQAAYYRDLRFADVWVMLERAPESLRARLEEIPGVAAVDTRVTFLATLDLPGLDAPALGRFVSLPERGRPVLNDLHLRHGRWVAPGAADEVIVSEKFATARAYNPGASVRALINGRARDLTIVGIATSPEHTYATRPGSLFPEDDRYGILWMNREFLGPAYDMDGAFNEVTATVSPGVDPEVVMAALDEVLAPWGGRGAMARADQPSHKILEGELDQNRVSGTFIPGIFLAVAAFLLHLVLSRLIATQRGEIAVLKAFGYRDREIGIHYLAFALVAVASGVVLGTLAGSRLGDAYIGLYGKYFDFPALEHRVSARLFLLSSGISVVAAAVGALSAVRRAVVLPPAEAMRPEPPARFEPGLFEKLGLGRALAPAGRMVLRQLERRPVRALASSIGVAASIALLIVGLFLFDGVDFMMDLQFRQVQREDFAVTFEESLPASARFSLASLEGVRQVETFRAVAARLRAGHREREVALMGVDAEQRLRRLIDAAGRVRPVAAEGVILSAALARLLHVEAGDRLQVEFLEGRRATGSVVVAAVHEDYLGLSATMERGALARLAGESDRISGAYLLADEETPGSLAARLKNIPVVAGVASPADMLRTFNKQMNESLYITLTFLVGFAGVIVVAVIYNGARISLSERGRDLASLRVMGFRRGEAATLLLGEQAMVMVVAVPLGWALGSVLARMTIEAMATEAFRVPFVISPATLLASGLIAVAAALASGAFIRRRIDRLDLIEVLKTRE